MPALTPLSRAVNMRRVHTLGSAHCQRQQTSGSSLWPPRRPRHCVRFGFLAWGHGPSIFLRPLARPALPGFTATMGALTPEQAALRRPMPLAKRRRSTHEHRLEIGSGLPALRDSEHSIPNHLTAPAVALTHNPSARQAFWASPRMRRLAGRPCRNGFVLLRTAHSLPVAFHPSSRRRSYFQVQAGVCMPEEDFHLSGQSRSQAHSSLRRQGPIQPQGILDSCLRRNDFFLR